MNVMMLATHLNTGGITTYLLTLGKGLVAAGHKVVVVSGGGSQEADLKAAGMISIVADIRTKSEINPKIYFALPSLARVVREQKIDVMHGHTRVSQVVAWGLSKMTSVPFVSTCHGFFKARWARRTFPCWGRRVVAISAPVKDHLIRDLRVPAERIDLVPNGLDLERFPAVDDAVRSARKKELGLEGRPVIGIIARLSDVKGHDVLIRAVPGVRERFPKCCLLIVGEGKQEEMLRALVAQLKLEECVRFLPVVNRTAEFLVAFDVFVLPSLQEGLGLSVMEAQAAGLPVVASRVGGLPSLIEDGRTGRLVPPQDEQALASAICDVLAYPAAAAKMGRAARESVQKEFSLTQMVERTLQVYRSAAGAGHVGH